MTIALQRGVERVARYYWLIAFISYVYLAPITRLCWPQCVGSWWEVGGQGGQVII